MVRWLTLRWTIHPCLPGLVLFAWVCADARPAAAQDLGNCQWQKSGTINRLGKDHTKLIGEVEISCGDQTFSADEVELFNDTHRLLASGNVVFTSENNRIAADRLEYNTETRTGTFYNATGTATLKSQGPVTPGAPPQTPSMFGTAEPDVYFYGKTLQKIGREKYRITRGGFTTCVQPTPRWSLTSGSLLLNLEHYAILTNSLFKVKGVPVLYLPLFYYPVNKEDRATGFLIPTYGSSTIRGQTLSNAFFWAINRSQDATFFHDWYSNTGQGFGTEYRYSAAAGSDGQIRFYNLREHAAEYQGSSGSGSTVTTPERRSYEVRGFLSQKLGRRFRARGRADYFSNITVQQTYNQNIYNASQRQRSFSGAVTGNVKSWNLNSSVDRSEFFYGTTQSTVRGGTPRVALQRADTPLFGSPVYFSMSAEGAKLLAERRTGTKIIDNGVTRFDLFPRVRVPFTKWQFLTVSTSAAFRYTFWNEQRDAKTGLNIQDSIHRNYYELSAQLTGPVLTRIFSRPGSGYAEKLKHSVEPFMTIQRVSAIDHFDSFVQLDGTDTVVGNVTRLNYGVANRFFRKPGGGGRSREILTATLGQSYYTDARAAQYDRYYQTAYGSAPSKYSPLSLMVRAWPTDGVNAQFRAEYDTKFKAIRTMSADGTVVIGDWFNATAGWSQRRFIEGLPGFNDKTRLDHYLNNTTTMRFWHNRLGAAYNFNYDVRTRSFLQQHMMGNYNAQCCGFSLEYQAFDLSRLGTLTPVTQDHRLSFSITLAGIGSFSNPFGSFGGGGGTRY
jgi:LPS-assembly protein